MRDVPEARESKAIRWPSLPRLGPPVRGPLTLVSWVGLRPSLSDIQISEVPERSDWNTTWVPSGEYCGTSWLREAAARALPRSVGDVRSRRHSSKRCCSRTNAISPGGELLVGVL